MAQTHSQSHVHFPPLAPLSNTTTSSTTTTTTYTSTSDQPDSRPALADGRRNSQGDVLASPIESWKPDVKRRQSFQREDLKRTVYGAEMSMTAGTVEGERGFTEGGAGSRKI